METKDFEYLIKKRVTEEVNKKTGWDYADAMEYLTEYLQSRQHILTSDIINNFDFNYSDKH